MHWLGNIAINDFSHRLLWDHMNKMAAVLLSTADVMKGFLRSSYLAVKELIAFPSWKYLHHCPERKHTDQPPQVVMKGEDDYQEHFEIAGKIRCSMLLYLLKFMHVLWLFPSVDVLLYYSEGFLPFLRIFYSEFYRKGHFDQSDHEGDATDNIYKSLLVSFGLSIPCSL